MSIKTQGTQLYVIDPATGTVLKVGCATSINGIDTTVDQIEDTCLDSGARTYKGGMPTPGAATFGINFDPADQSHVRLHQLKVLGGNLEWALGFSDGKDIAPTVQTDTNGDHSFVIPATRTWLTFEGFLNAYPFTFALNAVVNSQIGIQISGEPELITKTP